MGGSWLVHGVEDAPVAHPSADTLGGAVGAPQNLVAPTVGDAAQLLHVDVDQVSRPFVDVALDPAPGHLFRTPVAGSVQVSRGQP